MQGKPSRNDTSPHPCSLTSGVCRDDGALHASATWAAAVTLKMVPEACRVCYVGGRVVGRFHTNLPAPVPAVPPGGLGRPRAGGGERCRMMANGRALLVGCCHAPAHLARPSRCPRRLSARTRSSPSSSSPAGPMRPQLTLARRAGIEFERGSKRGAVPTFRAVGSNFLSCLPVHVRNTLPIPTAG